MVYIILILIAIIFVAGVEPLARWLKIPFPIFLMLFGILFSTYGIYDFLGYLNDINIGVNEIDVLASFSIEIAFLIAGLSLSLTNIRKNKRSTLFLATVPAFFECLVVGIFSYFLYNLMFQGEATNSPIFIFLFVAAIFAMSSSIVIIPLILEVKTKKDAILDQVSFGSVADNFIMLPILVILFLLTQNVIGLTEITIFSVILILGLTILTIIGAGVIGYLYGSFVSYIFNKFENYEKLKSLTICIILIIGSLIIINISSILWGILGLITAFFIGLTFDSKANNPEIKIKTHKLVGQIYDNLLMPLIFIYIGSKLRLDLLLNITNLILVILVIIVALITRSLVIYIFLKLKGYSKQEIITCNILFSAKGIMPLYFLPFLSPIFIRNGLDSIGLYFVTLMTVSTIITVPFGLLVGYRNLKKISDN